MLSVDTLMQGNFWQQFAPELHIQSPDYNQAPMPSLQADALQTIAGLVRCEGYFQGTLTQWNTPCAAVTDVISRLNAAGLPPVFAFMYDEMWLLAHPLHPVIEGLIGPNYAMLPDFWAWHVDPAKAESGWRPEALLGERAVEVLNQAIDQDGPVDEILLRYQVFVRASSS